MQQTHFSKPASFEARYDNLASFWGSGVMQVISAGVETGGSSSMGAGLWPSRFLLRDERHALEGAIVSSRSIGAHVDLFGEREHADNLFLMKDGWACRYMITREGGRQLIALLVPGDLCNLDCLLFDRLDYGVRTLTQSTIVAWPRDKAVALATKYPGIARMFARRALVENATLGKWALTLGRLSATQRLAHLFCELSVRLGMEDNDKSSFEFPLTQEHIGDVLGLTAVHVNRMVQLLRGEGLISLSNRTLTIQNVAKLRRIGGFDPHYLHVELDDAASADRMVTPRSSSWREGPPSKLEA